METGRARYLGTTGLAEVRLVVLRFPRSSAAATQRNAEKKSSCIRRIMAYHASITHQMGYPSSLDGWFHGKSQAKMDENWRYPYDPGNLHIITVSVWGIPSGIITIACAKLSLCSPYLSGHFESWSQLKILSSVMSMFSSGQSSWCSFLSKHSGQGGKACRQTLRCTNNGLYNCPEVRERCY